MTRHTFFLLRSPAGILMVSNFEVARYLGESDRKLDWKKEQSENEIPEVQTLCISFWEGHMSVRKEIWKVIFTVLILSGSGWGAVISKDDWRTPGKVKKIERVWRPLRTVPGEGLLSERLSLWRQGRMIYMIDAENEYLLSGFERRPGRHPWQGEHFGKWLHAAALAYEQTHDEKLLKSMQQMVDRLLATQDANGYIGTYAADYTFMAKPENESLSGIADDITMSKKKKKKSRPKGGWDIWTMRYNLYGLLTYEKFHPDMHIVNACKKMADLLIEYYGVGKYDLTKYGTLQGISSTTLLESIVMLYERVGEEKYLDFARHIVEMSENNPKLRLMGTMLDNGSVVEPGDGKAYQLMANLLGYLRLYQCTNDERYFTTVRRAWEKIRANHTYVTGGPWSIKMDYNGNRECFAYPKDFDPVNAVVETCSTTTWILLNLRLFEHTGEAKYATEAERALFNALLAAQYREGIDWCYYTRANQPSQPYSPKITCCASSGPRALEMYANYVAGVADGAVSFASLVPCTLALPEEFGNAEIRVTGNYPVTPGAVIRFEKAAGVNFPVEFRAPAGARLNAVRINGKKTRPHRNKRGFYRLYHTWKKGDEIAIDFEYLLGSHIEIPKNGMQWVAFTFGPWALAQIHKKDDVLSEPFAGKDIYSKPVTEWLEACPVKKGELPLFRIRGTEIILKPYFSTCDRDAGPRTYFRFAGSAAKSARRKPNIIFFLVDDLGWSDVRCYGSSFYDTPNIDRLAREGVRFTDAYATCHVCSPSRASILTGKYPARLKLTDWLPGRKDYPFQRLKNAKIRQALPLEEITLAEVLKRHGYRTAIFGKWHLGEAQAGPLNQGFDVQIPKNWYKGWPKAGYYYPFKLDGLSGRKGDYLTDRLTDEALRFIERSKNAPFFLYLSHFAVHDPIQGRADLVKKYVERRKKLPTDYMPFILEGNPDSDRTFTRAQLDRMIKTDEYAAYRVFPNRLVKVKQRQDNPEFAAMVESVDESLGRIMIRLKELGLEKDTIIIFTSDNGGMAAANFGRPDRVIDPAKLNTAYSTSNLPLRGAKGWLYEGGIRVPLIIKWPGKGRPGTVINEPVIGVDFYPTILEMADIPEMPRQDIDGKSLVPLFNGKTTLARDAIYWHFPHYSNHGMQSPGGAIRSGRYKLIEYFENGTVQLFDLLEDPGEQNDLSKKRPDIARKLRMKLQKWRHDVGAEGMELNPDYTTIKAKMDKN